MNIFKSKLLWLTPIAIILILMIFAIAFYPAFNPKPKDMPIAIVNHDEGTSIQGKKMNIGDKLEDKLLDSDSKAIKWVKVDSEKDAKKGMENEKYYGAAIFEKDFSKHAMSKTQKVVMDSKKAEMKEKVESGEVPAQQAQMMAKKMGNQSVDVKQAQLKTIVSQGSSLQGSQMATNVLSGMGDNINKQITKQSLQTLEKQNVKVDAKDIDSVTNPVKVDNEKINKVKDHQGGGNAPFLMFMPIWMGSIVISVLLFFAFRTSGNIKIAHRLIASVGQIVFTAIAAFAGSFAYVYFMGGALGFDFDHPNRVAIFVALAIMGFVGLILGTMTWLGMKSVPIFFIAMFFSMQMVMLPKQMLPKFYQRYIVQNVLKYHHKVKL